MHAGVELDGTERPVGGQDERRDRRVGGAGAGCRVDLPDVEVDTFPAGVGREVHGAPGDLDRRTLGDDVDDLRCGTHQELVLRWRTIPSTSRSRRGIAPAGDPGSVRGTGPCFLRGRALRRWRCTSRPSRPARDRRAACWTPACRGSARRDTPARRRTRRGPDRSRRRHRLRSRRCPCRHRRVRTRRCGHRDNRWPRSASSATRTAEPIRRSRGRTRSAGPRRRRVAATDRCRPDCPPVRSSRGDPWRAVRSRLARCRPAPRSTRPRAKSTQWS